MKPKSWQPRPDNGRINKFHIFLEWLRSLGGTFEPVRNLDEPKLPTGRRANRPNQYELDNEKYGMDPKTGTIWRRPVTV